MKLVDSTGSGSPGPNFI